MIANKHITKIIAVIMAVSVCLCLAAVIFAEDLAGTFGGEGIGVEYES